MFEIIETVVICAWLALPIVLAVAFAIDEGRADA